ncbi:hypothetical protein [Streptomyces atriruber]|uniref:hypothetical protein n=1 Tax=Streptomyces atriruber TaxID=545121 RepID=UPI0012FEE0C4|nr:hypothetical protein [Streptomyces atriruber]
MTGGGASEAVSFSYDEQRIPVYIEWIEEAYAGADSYDDIASRIFDKSRGVDDRRLEAEVREVASTFYYRIELDRGDAGKAGSQIEPRDVDDSGQTYWPRPLKQVDSEVKELWANLLSQSRHPELTALLADILFTVRYGKSHLYAREAVDGYVSAKEGGFNVLHKGEMLVRAWTLMRSIRAHDLETTVITAMEVFADDALNSAAFVPGAVIPLLPCLLREPLSVASGLDATRDDASKSVQLLFAAFERYQADYLSLQLADIARNCLRDVSLVDRALRLTVDNMLAEADGTSDALVKMHRLDQAAKFARQYHLDDQHDEAVRRIQSVDQGSFNWVTISSESGMRASDIESYLRGFDRSYLFESLAKYFNTFAPSGSRSTNEETARNILTGSLFGMFGSMRYGAHGLPQQSYSADSEKLEQQVGTVEAMAMGFNGEMLAAALHRMKARHGVPEVDTLHGWFTETYGSDSGLCASLALSLSLFWREEYLACVQVAMPRVEAAVRSLCLLLDEPIYRVEEGRAPGQFPGLGFMLPQLEKHGFDPDWSSFLRALLLPSGKNLRNLGAHGFVQEVDAPTAALVIRALGVVALVAPSETSKLAAESDAVRRSLRFPTSVSRTRSWRARLALRLIARLTRGLLK